MSTPIWAFEAEIDGNRIALGTYEGETAEEAEAAFRDETGADYPVAAERVETHRHWNPGSLEWMTDDEATERFGEGTQRFGWNGPKGWSR